MRKKVALISSVIMALMVIISPLSNMQEVQASEFSIIDEYILFENAKLLKDVGIISKKNSLLIDGEKNYLYPTFDDIDTAFNNIRDKACNILGELYVMNNVGELCQENWEIYYEMLNTLGKTIYESEKKVLFSFFDVCEGEYLNQNIIDCVNSKSTDQQKRNELMYLLPYTSPFVIKENSEQNNGISLCTNFNTDVAIRYARAYATNPNIYDYDYFDSDCTNFASQIMENGGVDQDDDMQYSWVGWWHVKDGNAHYQSRSWTLANQFARYFGVDYSSESHFSFSANVETGVFILLDINNDGSWNHVAFVVDSDNYLTNGYYDYFVAQHSDNYLAWTSTSENGWDIAEQEGHSYGIVIP